LSSRSREKLRNYLRRVQQRAPTFSFETLSVGEFDLSQIKQVLAFNRARMQAKGKHFGMNAVDERKLCQLMLERGQLSLINIDGEPRAGLLCTRVGRDVFMHVIAHDPAFDDLRLGYLCCALAIEAAITHGDQRFHFLWGRYDYKTRLGGERQILSRVLIFRYPWQVLLQPGQMLEHVTVLLRAWARRMRHR
jgi:CelD/BcsL family acetyltransferase involved in cellulose biosynthesis